MTLALATLFLVTLALVTLVLMTLVTLALSNPCDPDPRDPGFRSLEPTRSHPLLDFFLFELDYLMYKNYRLNQYVNLSVTDHKFPSSGDNCSLLLNTRNRSEAGA